MTVTADRLVGGSGDIAGKVEVHEMAMNNGVMKMRPLGKGLMIEAAQKSAAHDFITAQSRITTSCRSFATKKRLQVEQRNS